MDKKLRLPKTPNGMIAIDPPNGTTGVVFVPDPDEYLPAFKVDAWLTRTVPDELAKAATVFQSFYRRAIFCEFHIEKNGKPIHITEETLKTLEYPAQLAYMIYDATEPLLSAMFAKKK
ncbi:MAG: hypothetical protein KC419_08145 [Anaerolineales bacterium]|nr:hypothetical protein [Anaerolineales bacterium]